MIIPHVVGCDTRIGHCHLGWHLILLKPPSVSLLQGYRCSQGCCAEIENGTYFFWKGQCQMYCALSSELSTTWTNLWTRWRKFCNQKPISNISCAKCNSDILAQSMNHFVLQHQHSVCLHWFSVWFKWNENIFKLSFVHVSLQVGCRLWPWRQGTTILTGSKRLVSFLLTTAIQQSLVS